MNNIATILVSGGIFGLLASIVTAIGLISVNRANATKLVKEGEKSTAETAELFSRLAGEWTERATKVSDKLETRVNTLVDVLDGLTVAVDGITPLLQLLATSPEHLEKLRALEAATTKARRAYWYGPP